VAEQKVGRERVLAFRAAAQSLDRRRPMTELAGVVGACGIQDTPPGNADVSLAARLDIDGPVVKGAVAARDLVLAWSLRGAPHLFPPDDHAVFTLGACPADDTLDALWGQPEHSLVEIEKAMVRVIRSTSSPKGEVSAAVTAAVPAELAPWCAACKAHHPKESIFRATSLLGRLVLTSTAPVLLTRAKAWLGADAKGDIEVVRTELQARYLHCYASTTRPLRGVGRHLQAGRQAAVGGVRRRPGAGSGRAEGIRAGGGSRTPHGDSVTDRRAPAPGQGRVHAGPGSRRAAPRSRPPQGRLPDPGRPRSRPARRAPGRHLARYCQGEALRGAGGGALEAGQGDLGRHETEAQRVAHVRGHEAATVVREDG